MDDDARVSTGVATDGGVEGYRITMVDFATLCILLIMASI